VASHPNDCVFLPDFELGFDLRRTITVVIADAVLTANRTPEFKYLRFVQFSATITTEEKEALGFF
jgi:hypothetical protein